MNKIASMAETQEDCGLLACYFLQLVDGDWLAKKLSASIFRVEHGGNTSEDNYINS
jgi:hypothetical protein